MDFSLILFLTILCIMFFGGMTLLIMALDEL